MTRLFINSVLAFMICPAVMAQDDQQLGTVDFTLDVRPILADHCLPCHGPDVQARRADLRLDLPSSATSSRDGLFVIKPGDPHASLLVERILSTDPDDRMPPPDHIDQLDQREKDILIAWIRQGARYDAHWAWERSASIDAPSVSDPAWCRNPVDRFILARLDSAGLSPTREADRATLARRASLDLVGLPPEPAMLEEYLDDDRPDAYERYVERLLASERFGEHWARSWLDLARYADTKGYEQDGARTIWPWRDWVIQAYNADMPFDRFTIEQLAGDMLPDARPDQVLATAFNRNTMNNDEGGTDDEEFRVASVVDRVNTTMEIWTGMTVGCAQCHDHKYDPISQQEYYELFAVFNNTADRDTQDESPVLSVLGQSDQDRSSRLRDRIIEQTTRLITSTDTGSIGEAIKSSDSVDSVSWIDDELPPVALELSTESDSAWPWVRDEKPGPVSGDRYMHSIAGSDRIRQHYCTDSLSPMVLAEGDRFSVWVHVDPEDPPRQIMVQLHSLRSWEHRVYWGENHVTWGIDGTPSRKNLGQVPEGGSWIRLEFAPEDVGLSPGAVVDGIAFTQYGGTVSWDVFSLVGQGSAPVHQHDPDAWHRMIRASNPPTIPPQLRPVVSMDPGELSEADRRIRDGYWYAMINPSGRNIHEAQRRNLADAQRELAEVEARRVPVPVMRELDRSEARTTYVLQRGSHLDPADQPLDPGVPGILSASDEPVDDRLEFARWLVDPANPLTARVQVNRAWESIFGTGIVETTEDFGTQGELPSHPELLDWLAMDFIDNQWSWKHLLRTIVTSSAYRQSSVTTPELLRVDPYNRLISRGSRYRLAAETLRDQALYVSGLLSGSMFGPSVYPPQPEGVWKVVYNGSEWMTSNGEDRYRRGLYTYWRRTSPYPSMMTFDAPSREVCVSRRIRTNTPLQALILMNDPVFVETALALAASMHQASPDGSDRAMISDAFRVCTCREPEEEELQHLVQLLQTEMAHYEDNPGEAVTLLEHHAALSGTPREQVPRVAALSIVANVLLNLDEVLTRN